MMANWINRSLNIGFFSTMVMFGIINSSFAFSPQPFQLELEGFFYRGIPIQVSGTQSLEQRPGGFWRMTLNARGLVVQLTEQSDFIWTEQGVRPLRYYYELSAPFENDSRRIEFDPLGNEIRAFRNGEQATFPYDPTWLDPLSYTLLLKRDLLTGQTEFEYTLFDRNQPRTYQFEQIEHRYAPNNAIVLSQIEPNHGDIFIVFSADSFLPAHLLRWNNGRINYQIKTLKGDYNGQYWDTFPHWPNPRRFSP